MIFGINSIVFISIFIYLVIYHKNLRERMKYTSLIRDINLMSLKRLNSQWNSFEDDGAEFKDDSHNFLTDLDIFGKNSLFQWINCAKTYIGRQKLRNLLSGIEGSLDDIRNRQEAVNELAEMLYFRQRLLAEGMVASDKMNNPEELIAWASESFDDFRKPWVIALCRIMPCITIILILIGLVMKVISWRWPIAALLIQYALIGYKSKKRYRTFAISENYSDNLRAYYKMLKLFEKHQFNSKLINLLKDNIKNKDGLEAFKQMDNLSSIIDSISNRRNAFYLIFNVLTLWDFQMIIALERWKEKSGHLLKKWLETIGELEALASLSLICFDNPEWTMPIIYNGEEAVFEARGIGHPLIKNRVLNNLKFDKKVILITGSNMSGKSTLLRTAGINLILAYAGAPVCAKYFKASIMEVYTCMRISDNLSENISSFYAELLRIKNIISEAKTGKRIFYLLDEIFKGTNSLDRHTGARVLINKLSSTNSIGMVSTHDLELCDLEEENEKVVNYHFQEYYRDNKIYFDYKLRPGSSTTRNALFLMKLAGIDVNE